jgi:broad specificity phosphatase PhoE
MNRILLIRHGNTDMLGRVLCGRSPGVPLNASGRTQAVDLGIYLQTHEPLKAVFSSPLERAFATAECLAAPQRLPVRIDERLQEVDFGSWTGQTFEALSRLEEWRQYNEIRSLHHVSGGESFPAVQGRAGDFLVECGRSQPEGTVAVVTHADVIRSLLCLCLGCRWISCSD